jgi:hypothetical protein
MLMACAVELLAPAGVLADGSDTPSLPIVNGVAGNGDCWQPYTPLMCRVTWPGRAYPVYFRAIDQFSSGNSSWRADANAAVNGWNNAPGPQWYSFTAHTNDTWIYLNYSQSGSYDLTDSLDGITWNCDRSYYCDDTGTVGMSIYWTDIYINHIPLDFQPIDHQKIQETFGHESGHGMGLAHNMTDSTSLMWYTINHVGVPNAHDTGIYPGCSNNGHGTMCIYGAGD